MVEVMDTDAERRTLDSQYGNYLVVRTYQISDQWLGRRRYCDLISESYIIHGLRASECVSPRK